MKRQGGVSLIELSAIVAILGIIALVTVPSLSTSDQARLELAAGKVADALRFARSEAMRTGSAHGVLVDTDDSYSDARDLAVFLPETTASPFGVQSFVQHPLQRKSYDLWLDEPVMLRNVFFTGAALPFSFNGVSGKRKFVFFDAQGVPFWLEDGTRYRLTAGEIRLVHGDESRTVALAPVSGQVTVQ